MKEVLYIEGRREGYGVDQIAHTMTIGELIAYLEQFDEDTPVYLRNGGGYTYGSITDSSFEDGAVDEDGNPVEY